MRNWIPVLIGCTIGVMQAWCVANEQPCLLALLEWLSEEVERG